MYLYLAGIGSGSMAIGILMGWLGYTPDELRPLVLWGPVLVAVGALFLVLKLGIKRRFLNTVLNPMTSWLSRGFYILSVCIISGLLVLAISILPYLENSLDFSFVIWPWLVTLLDIIGFVSALGTAVYTGVLIMSVRYVPFWNTLLLPALFTVSALSTGTMAAALATTAWDMIIVSPGLPDWFSDILIYSGKFHENLAGTLSGIEWVLIVIEITVISIFLYTRYKTGEYGMYSVRLLLSGRYRYIFWAGIVACGIFVPVVMEGAYAFLHEQKLLLFIAGAFLLLGGFFIRYAIVYAGIKEEAPMLRFVESRRSLAAKDSGNISEILKNRI